MWCVRLDITLLLLTGNIKLIWCLIRRIDLRIIFRDYHIGTLVIAAVSTRDPIIKHESISSRADNGRGLILRAMTKVPWYNLFITYSKTFFQKNFD